MMKWIRSLPFVQSASLHGGELVISYPFDFSRDLHEERKFSPTPDEQVTDVSRAAEGFYRLSRFTAVLFPRLSSGWLAPTRTITPPCQTTTPTGAAPLFTGPEASSTGRCGTALPEVRCCVITSRAGLLMHTRESLSPPPRLCRRYVRLQLLTHELSGDHRGAGL